MRILSLAAILVAVSAFGAAASYVVIHANDTPKWVPPPLTARQEREAVERERLAAFQAQPGGFWVFAGWGDLGQLAGPDRYCIVPDGSVIAPSCDPAHWFREPWKFPTAADAQYWAESGPLWGRTLVNVQHIP